MTRAEALALVREIERLAADPTIGDVDKADEVKWRVERLVDAPGSPALVREKVASIAGWTEILSSPEKRATYGGREEITELLLHDCERLRDVIKDDVRRGD